MEISEISDARRIQIVEKIIQLTQDTLVARMPFLNRALFRLPLSFEWDDDESPAGTQSGENGYGSAVPPGFPEHRKKSAGMMGRLETAPAGIWHPDVRIYPTFMGTDGNFVFCEKRRLIKMFREEKPQIARTYLHMVFHCIFYHPFQYDRMMFELWDFVTDAAVENTMLDLNWQEITLQSDPEKRRILSRLKSRVKKFTAENLYHYYFLHPDEAQADMEYAPLFRQDDHRYWVSVYGLLGREMFSRGDDLNMQGKNSASRWKETSRTIQLEAEAYARFQETLPGSAIDSIREVFRERCDYREFLKKFAAPREEIRVNRDEFDYIYYTYGMKLYGNIPLIEPLEYQDASRIHDFVIAVDTSGSCQGSVVRRFLNQTYTILKESGAFFRDMNVHIIQCDSKVQDDRKITGDADLENYVKDLKVGGCGGTDFRPVFEHVEALLKRKEFTDLRGLLYFTDGLGTYPKSAPEYPAAFVILEDPQEKPKVPAWAVRVDIREEDLVW